MTVVAHESRVQTTNVVSESLRLFETVRYATTGIGLLLILVAALITLGQGHHGLLFSYLLTGGLMIYGLLRLPSVVKG